MHTLSIAIWAREKKEERRKKKEEREKKKEQRVKNKEKRIKRKYFQNLDFRIVFFS